MQVFLCRATVLLWYGLCSEEQTLHEVEKAGPAKKRVRKKTHIHICIVLNTLACVITAVQKSASPITLFDLASAGELAHTHHGTEAHKIFLRSYILPAHRGGTMLCSAKPVAACRATFLHCSRRERVGTSS